MDNFTPHIIDAELAADEYFLCIEHINELLWSMIIVQTYIMRTSTETYSGKNVTWGLNLFLSSPNWKLFSWLLSLFGTFGACGYRKQNRSV